MALAEVNLQCGIIKVVLLRVAPLTGIGVSSIADVASLMLLTAVSVKLVVAVEPLATKSTLRVTLETRLIYGAGVVISITLVLP